MRKYQIQEYLSSNNFARNSDLVFSEVLSKKEFEKLDSVDLKVVYEEKNKICYINKNLKIRENDIIFTNTDFMKYLFKELKKVDNLHNLKLITQWSDQAINKESFINKPSSISNWYGIHVNFEHEKLHPIPLGLSGEYSDKNLTPSFFKKNEYDVSEKRNLLYINFQKNTNEAVRMNITKNFEGQDWVKIDQPNLQLNEYLDEIKNSSFVLCPFGNGFDTHRLWETLYAGSIPIVLNHISYQTTDELPVLVVDDYKQLTEEYLKNTLREFSKVDYNLDKLNIDYWIKDINSIKNNSSEVSTLFLSELSFQKIKFSYNLYKFINRIIKKIIFRKNQILKKIQS